jgi:hypothetical protein
LIILFPVSVRIAFPSSDRTRPNKKSLKLFAPGTIIYRGTTLLTGQTPVNSSDSNKSLVMITEPAVASYFESGARAVRF